MGVWCVCVMGVWCVCVSGCDGGVYVVRCMAKVVDQPVSSAPLPGGRPPALGPSRGQAAASSCAGLWRSCLGPRPPASLHDPGMLHEGGGVEGEGKGKCGLTRQGLYHFVFLFEDLKLEGTHHLTTTHRRLTSAHQLLSLHTLALL